MSELKHQLMLNKERSWVPCYPKAEVDEAIAELKDEVKLCSDFSIAARKDIEEMRGQHQMLKQFGHYKLSPVPGKMINHEVRQYVSYNVVCMIINHLESENADLKQKLESVQASAYADGVDAGMRERRLKRSLWLSRANRAGCEIDYWRKCYEHVDDYFDVRTGQDLEAKRCEKMIRNWIDVKIKCQAKAKEYK